MEQAARKRTYLLRVAYAALLFTFFCALCYEQFRQAEYQVATLGAGKRMFELLVAIQFAGICLFLPAMMSGALTDEKERGSLALLVLTDLRPREILLQKYLAHLVPVFTVLLASLPLLAVCYAYGGMTTDYLLTGVYTLILACLQAGAIALLCSAWCRTSLGALLSSYAAVVAFYTLVPLVTALALSGLLVLPLSSYDEILELTAAAIAPMWLFALAAGAGASFALVALAGVLILLSTSLILVLARVFVLRRGFLSPKRTLAWLLGLLDRFFGRLNRLTGGVQVAKGGPALPEDQPIAWRETHRKPLSRTHNLVRLLVALEVVIVVFTSGIVATHRPSWNMLDAMTALSFALWLLAALTITVVTAHTLAAERARQTLEVLLTTPMSGRQILLQKLAGVRRLILLFSISLLSVFLVEGVVRSAVYTIQERQYSGYPFKPGLYLLTTIPTMMVYLPLLMWVAAWVTLRARRRFRAVVAALAALVAWSALPWLLLALAELSLDIDLFRQPAGFLLAIPSPATMVVIAEMGCFFDVDLGWPILTNLLLHGLLLLSLRQWCLSRADRCLGRVPAPWRAGETSQAAELAGEATT